MKSPSQKKVEVVVLLEQDGMRIDALLAPFFVSRSQAEKAIKKSRVYRSLERGRGGSAGDESHFVVTETKQNLVVITKPSHRVKVGECYYIFFSVSFEKPCGGGLLVRGLRAYDVSIPVIFEDEHLLVIDKPAGLPVQTGPGHEQDSVINGLLQKTTLSSGVDPLRPGLVHRLDKDVSGLMVLSKTKKAEGLLIEQFKKRELDRSYRALVVGVVKESGFSVMSFIGRHPKDRKKFYSFDKEVKGSKKALTHFRCLRSFRGAIHDMECRLETGRTHQIRVHLKSQGLPILQDHVYFPLRSQRRRLQGLNLKAECFDFKGMALYSAELKFVHPVSKKILHFKLPWPEGFCSLLGALGFPEGLTPNIISPIRRR